jgi:serine/threonine protein kinase
MNLTPIRPGDDSPNGEATLAAGETVGSRYLLKQIVGRGGMGVVWLADDTRLKEPVALKFLPPDLAGDAVALERLRRETLRSRKLSHPNIIRIHDFYEGAGQPAFISMEYVEGPNLHYVRTARPSGVLSWKQIARVVAELCEALEYAHKEGVIHRDLKPANLMLDSSGRLKLADFGLARIARKSATPGAEEVAGTLAYMSPQQAAGCGATVSDDIYSFGATLYELLTSEPPFHTGDIAYQIQNTRPQPLNERLLEMALINDVPSGICALIMACLAKDPAQRPSSAAAIIEWLNESPPTASPAPGAVK